MKTPTQEPNAGRPTRTPAASPQHKPQAIQSMKGRPTKSTPSIGIVAVAYSTAENAASVIATKSFLIENLGMAPILPATFPFGRMSGRRCGHVVATCRGRLALGYQSRLLHYQITVREFYGA